VTGRAPRLRGLPDEGGHQGHGPRRKRGAGESTGGDPWARRPGNAFAGYREHGHVSRGADDVQMSAGARAWNPASIPQTGNS